MTVDEIIAVSTQLKRANDGTADHTTAMVNAVGLVLYALGTRCQSKIAECPRHQIWESNLVEAASAASKACRIFSIIMSRSSGSDDYPLASEEVIITDIVTWDRPSVNLVVSLVDPDITGYGDER